MRIYQRPGTIYSMPERKLEKDVKRCAMDYLDLYLEMLDQAEAAADPTYAARIEAAQTSYRNDIITKDKSRQMLAKLIGKKKANRIFQEVLVVIINGWLCLWLRCARVSSTCTISGSCIATSNPAT